MVKLSCVFCSKGKLCPIHSTELYFKTKNFNNVDNLYSTSPPSVFVGSKLKYPSVNVGILSPVEKQEEAWVYDAQNYWANNYYSINEIINLRKSLINSRFKTTVYSLNSEKLIELSQEIGMAVKPVDVEIELKNKVNINLDFDKINLPQGPRAELKKIKITNNPKIPNKINKVFYDKDLKAVEALDYLYQSGYDEKTLSQLLSVGVLGVKKNRRLVPTRFSITAVDDTIGKSIIDEIQDYSTINNYKLYFDGYLGNYYLVLLFPEVFSYELFETYLPETIWNSSQLSSMTDYESVFGRKYYAEITAGGYYSARLGVLEHLRRIKKQASALVLRFITSEYETPLGVWVTREATRKAMRNLILSFNNKEELLLNARSFMDERFGYDISGILKKSKLLNSLKQKKLSHFL